MFEFIDIKEANQAYSDKNYTKAINHYKNLSSDEAKYNLANSYYKNKQYQKAIQSYTDITKKELLFKSLHNLGNSYANIKEIDKLYMNKMSFYNLQEYGNKIIGIDGATSSRLGIIDINETNISKSKINYYKIGKDSRHYPYALYRDLQSDKSFYVCTDDGIKSFEIGDNNITIDFLYEIPINKKIIINNGYLYINGGLNGLFIYEIDDGNYKFITHIKEDDKYSALASFLIDKNYLYAIYTYGIFVYDISNPRNPTKITSFIPTKNDGSIDNSHGGYVGSKIYENYLYVTKDGSLYPLWIFDVSNRSTISLVGKLNKKLTPGTFDIVDNFLYLVVADNYLVTVDISDKSNPIMKENYIKLYYITSITHNDKYLFVGTWDYLSIFDTNKQNGDLSLIKSYKIQRISSMKIKDNYLHASSLKGFHTFNIQNVNNIFDTIIPNKLSSKSFYINNNDLYLGRATNYSSIEAIEIFDLDKLKEKHNIMFKKGWNLVALPVLNELNASKINCDILWKWDNIEKVFLYHTKNNTLDSFLKNKGVKKFKKIFPSEGFWAYCNNEFDMNLTGVSYKTKISNLTNGWNLIGYGSDINITSDIFSDIKYVWKYKDGLWYLWDGNIDSGYDEKYPKIENISSDEGVWIYK